MVYTEPKLLFYFFNLFIKQYVKFLLNFYFYNQLKLYL